MAPKPPLNSKAKARKVDARLGITADDLKDFGEIHGLLSVLNDPMAAGRDLAGWIEKIPKLKERLLRTARVRSGHLDLGALGPALNILGNRGLEAELLQLLEDMTIAKAELED
jgi:hypothetical protein